MSEFASVSDFNPTGIGRHIFVPHFPASHNILWDYVFLLLASLFSIRLDFFFSRSSLCTSFEYTFFRFVRCTFFHSFFFTLSLFLLLLCLFFCWSKTFAPSAIYLSFNFVRFANAHFFPFASFFSSSVCLLTTVIVNLYLTRCVCAHILLSLVLSALFYAVFMFRVAAHSIFGGSHLHAYSLAPLAKVI